MSVSFWWIYSYGSNKSTGKETGKTHLCALYNEINICIKIRIFDDCIFHLDSGFEAECEAPLPQDDIPWKLCQTQDEFIFE